MFKNFSKWFNYLDLYTRLLACTTVFISLLVSSMIYFILYDLHKSIIINHVELLNILIQVISLYIITTVEFIKYYDLAIILEQIYLTMQDICYLIAVEPSGNIISIFPDNTFIDPILLNILLRKNIKFHDVVINISDFVLSYSWQSHDIVDIVIPLNFTNNHNVNLHIGLINNVISLFNSSMIYTFILSVITFTGIWIVSFCTIMINFFMINESVKYIRSGINSICLGNFATRISYKNLRGLIGLGSDFNNMSKRLELYEQNNVKQLLLEKSKLETVLSIIADGLILLDQDLRIVFVNSSAYKNLTFLKSCIIGNYFTDYCPNYINRQIIPLLNDLVNCNPNVVYNISDYTKNITVYLNNDTSKTVELVITAVFDFDKKILNGIGISIQDITDQIVLNEAKTQFISNVSHELRTPLFNIRSFLETLSEYSSSLSEKQKMEFLEIANQETQRLTYLVNDVLDLSRLESEFIDILEPVELHEIAPPIIQTSYLRARTKKVKLSFQISRNVSTVYGYSNLLVQVLSNLIGNSLKFTRIDGRILLKIYLSKLFDYPVNDRLPRIRVEIIDEGTGIDELDQIRIFDRFVRLENNVHTLEGTGLGLSIVKNIIEKHSSDIHLYSELLIGSSFWFDLAILEKKS
uniref:Uncharacterized sensor-like histidine kinase ycf26 n=1 Tax=Helminthora furcellata TaxID=1884666 RepID=A0A1G4NRB2_9FLOR|nr:Drug sensory protein A [Helminthora furcellata]SCW21079.1 Drug sensory protein A [Helminthora furcellata]SCW23939.1 Drug sensory protein A [Helminthora furcellata]